MPPSAPLAALNTRGFLPQFWRSPRTMTAHSLPSNTTHPSLQLTAISVQRAGRTILDEVSLQIRAGEITVIVGPSGAGKSTLLATLNGLALPQSGKIFIGNANLAESATLQQHRLSTATIFQEHALIDRLSALDNVLLGLADARHPLSPFPWPRTLQYRAAEALRDVGLLPLAQRRVGNLSGGERQRVGIARALVRKPHILLGDEPFSALDPALSTHLGSELRSLAKSYGITVVLVLHQIELARALADRIVGLSAGRVVFDGTPSEFDLVAHDRLFNHPATV